MGRLQENGVGESGASRLSGIIRTPETAAFILCTIISLVFLAFATKSSFLYPLNDWVDANCFFTVGKAMMRGQTLYADIYDQKGPLLYALYGLCSLVSGTSFFGVYVMEAVAMTAFLFCSYKTAALYASKTVAMAAVPMLAACMLTARSFSHGGSAEELCLPLLAYPLYLFLRSAKEQRAPSVREHLLAGVLAGCVLWIKFTLTGMFIAFLLLALILPMTRRQWRGAAAVVGSFCAGVVIATLPFIVYFAFRGTLRDWIIGYFGNNIYHYAPPPADGLLGQLLRAAKNAWDALNANWQFAVWIGAGALWTAWKESRPVRLGTLLLLTGTAGGIYWGGQGYSYYALALCVFAAPGLGIVLRCIERAEGVTPHRFGRILVCVCLLSALFAYAENGNTPDLLRYRREDLPQFQFAAVMQESEAPTLLNYGFLDGGFYTAANILPTTKYFCRLNLDLAEMKAEQERYLRDAVTQYVVTRNLTLYSPRYTEVARAKMPYDVVEYTYTLYRRVV